MIGINESPLLKIKRVVVSGNLGCDISLDSGINIVKGEGIADDPTASNECGKSTFTDLIKYGLGDRDRFSSGSIAQEINLLFLEVEINGQIFTIRRDLNKPSARVAIFSGNYEPGLGFQEPEMLVIPTTPFSDHLLELLGIPNLRIPLSNKPGSQPQPITLQTFMRLLYMDQENSFQRIMNKVQPEWLKGKAVEILLGMAKEEVEQLKVRVQELTNDIDILQKEIENITRFLVTSGGANRIDIYEKIREKQRQRELLLIQISDVKHQMMGDRGLTDDLRENLQNKQQELMELQDKEAKVRLKMDDFEALVNSLMVDRDKIRKIKDAEYVLSSVDFVKCPRCLRRITMEMKRREEEGTCMLCERPLLEVTSSTEVLDQEDIVDEEINEVQILLKTYRENLEELESQISSLTDQKLELQTELDRQSSIYVSPFVDTLERLLQTRNQIDSDLEIFNQQLRQWELVEKSEEWLQQRKEERQMLRNQIAEFDTGDDSKIRKLSDYYESFLRKVGDPELISTRINPKDMMPLINGKPYTEDVGSGWQSVRTIAYHASILLLSLDEPTYYPRFLMLDSPRAFDLNRESYENLLTQFHSLQARLKETDFQVILTTRDLPEILEEFVIERLNNRNRMLLRLANEREQTGPPIHRN